MAPGDTKRMEDPPVPWLAWLAWAWVGFLLLAAVAEILGLEALRLSLDFQRHLR